MYAPPDYAQASARLREDVVTEGGETYGKWMLKYLLTRSTLLYLHIHALYKSFYTGPGTQEQVLANTKETARNQFVVPLVNRK